MKWLAIIAAGGTMAFAVATFRPYQVCEEASMQTRVYCQGTTCIAETSKPVLSCHWRN